MGYRKTEKLILKAVVETEKQMVTDWLRDSALIESKMSVTWFLKQLGSLVPPRQGKNRLGHR